MDVEEPVLVLKTLLGCFWGYKMRHNLFSLEASLGLAWLGYLASFMFLVGLDENLYPLGGLETCIV